MDYCSTREGNKLFTAAETISMGLAPDGGLFVPAGPWPQISLENLIDKGYFERAAAVISPFLERFSAAEINSSLQKAYGTGFSHRGIAPLHRLAKGLFSLELWHGPTGAFKDLALQFLPHLLRKAKEKWGDGSTAVILTATSGDTGKAALAGFCDLPGTKVIVFYPLEGVSEIQRRQMITQKGKNVHVVAVRGNFDHAQAGVKEMLTDGALAGRMAAGGLKFSSANSINWGRLLPQMVYYFSAYLDLRRDGHIEPGERVNFVVPTGNFGNILAGFYASLMGLPVHRLICAANRNHVLTDFFREGCYNRKRPFYRTLSPSMDILVSSNLERLLFELSDRDPAKVGSWMQALRERGFYQIDPALRRALAAIFWSDYADDGETVAAISKSYRQYRYLIDPHTAVALSVYEKYRAATGDQTATVIASTASPFKFAESVVRALLPPERAAGHSALGMMPLLAETTGLDIPAPLVDLDLQPVRHTGVVDRPGMREEVLGYLDL